MPNFEPFVAEEHKQESMLIPSGQYEFAITRTNMKPLSKGGEQLELDCTVQGGQYAGRIVFTKLYMVPPENPTDGQKMAVKIAKSTLGDILRAVGLATLTTSYDQLLGLPFFGDVVVEINKDPQYPDSNKIKKYMAKDAAAPVAVVAAGPWAK